MSTAASAARTWMRETLLKPIERVIYEAWPETRFIFTDTRVARSNWLNLMDDEEFGPPIVIIAIDLQPTRELGSDATAFQANISVNYVTWGPVDIAGKPQDGDKRSTLTEAGVAFTLVLAGAAGEWPFTLVDGSVGIDSSRAGEAMTAFLAGNLPLDAVEVKFQALCGIETPPYTLSGVPS